ncbi:MAG: hypothetical protein M1818_002544 [Claussenomyces sp. TS43310]|nr:MAG: hypothetical protein M1818_002544 [Claussenomyces sp. TS43310]
MSKSYQSASTKSSRKITFFVPGNGIDREVISTDICRYLGNDATVKPGTHTDMDTGAASGGYFVTAYRALTTEQLADLKADSVRWAAERQRNPPRGQSSGGISPRGSDAVMRKSNTIPTEGYRQSVTRQQGWSEPPPGREPGYAPQQAYPPGAPQTSRPGYSQPQYPTDRNRDPYSNQENYVLGPTEVAYPVQPGPRSLQPAYQDMRGQHAGPYPQQRQQPPQGYHNQPGQIMSPPGAQYVTRETPPPPYGRAPSTDSRDEPMDDFYEEEYHESPREPPAQSRPYREPEPPKDRHRDNRHGRR